MILSSHQPQYLPWLGYFDKINNSDCFVFLDTVQYKEREFQNRNKIRGGDGWIWLTVPVISKGQGRQNIADVKIDNSLDWRNKHWGSIKHCYGKTPFFNKYAGFFEDIYKTRWEKLMELNIHIIKHLLKELEIDTPLYYESEVGTSSRATDRIIEICQKLKADTYLSGAGGRAYLEEEKFPRAGIKLEYQEFKHPIYCQRSGRDEEDFIPYMSAVDLLFNEGDNSRNILKGKLSDV